MLHKKKPVPDSRVLKEVTGGEADGKLEQKLEFGVMVIGGAAAVRGGEEEVIPPVAGVDEQGLGDDFWRDLKGFLVQRLKSEEVGGKAAVVFKKAWEAQK